MSAPQHDFLDELIHSAQRDLPPDLEQRLLAIPSASKLPLVRWVMPTLAAVLTPILWLFGGQQILDRVDRLQVSIERLIIATADRLVALAAHFAASEPEVMAITIASIALVMLASLAAAIYINYQGRNELYIVGLVSRAG